MRRLLLSALTENKILHRLLYQQEEEGLVSEQAYAFLLTLPKPLL